MPVMQLMNEMNFSLVSQFLEPFSMFVRCVEYVKLEALLSFLPLLSTCTC